MARLPVTQEQENIAQRLYGKSFKDLTNTQRVDIRKGKFIDDKITFEQYLEDYKGMANDPDYKPKYIKANKGTGMSAQQIRARAEAKKNIEGFETKFNKNVSKRKRIKMKAALEADPERKQIEMAKKAERRRGRRVAKLADKSKLTPNEKLLNFEQSLITRQLNDKIKANPNIILNNKKLMNLLSITVDKDGNIILSKPTIYELEKRGLFEIEHQRDVRKAGAMKDFPYNRNPILGPYNRSGGFKNMAEKFIEKNPDPNNTKVKNIIKTAEKLKITLQPEVPQGTFKTKGLGYKQPANATAKFIEYAKSTLPELVDDKIGLKGFTGNTSMLETGLGLKRGTIDLEKIKQVYESEPKGSVIRKGMDDIVKCADGCFVKVANKNPEKTLNKINKEPQKLIRLFRGEGFKSRSGPTIKEMAKTFNVSEAEAKKKLLSGQWFTSDPVAASSYTDKLGKTKYVDVTPREFLNFKKYVDRVNKTKSLSGGERYSINKGDKLSIVPRYKLDEFEKANRLKSQRNFFKKFNLKTGYAERPPGVLTYDSVLGGFVDSKYPTQKVSDLQIKNWATENPMPVKAGTEDALKPIKGNLLKTVGKSLAYVGAPLPTALIDTYFIGKQIAEDRPAAEIAKDPLNWLGLATMSTLSEISGVTKPGKMNAALRLGMSPGLIRGVSRFAGLPGLAISTALTAYDQYNKYKNEEGLIYDFFNKDSKAI